MAVTVFLIAVMSWQTNDDCSFGSMFSTIFLDTAVIVFRCSSGGEYYHIFHMFSVFYLLSTLFGKGTCPLVCFLVKLHEILPLKFLKAYSPTIEVNAQKKKMN